MADVPLAQLRKEDLPLHGREAADGNGEHVPGGVLKPLSRNRRLG